jgi:hypothetical protein
MLVMSREADVTADVVHQGGIFQPFALPVHESVHRARLIEERERQAYYLIGMLGVIAAALCEFQRAPSTDVGDAVDLRDLTAVAANVVEHQAFTERKVTERQFFGAEPAENRIEQNCASHHKVGSPRVESGDGKALLEIQLRYLFAHLSNLLYRDVEIAQLCWSGAACGGRSNRSDAENRSRCPDHTVETGRENLFAVAIDFAKHMLDDFPLVALGERVAAHEVFGQTYRSNLEAARKLQGGRGAKRNLDAAPSDVDDRGTSAAHIDAVYRGLMNETGLFDSRNDPRADTGLALKTSQEFTAVASLAGRAGRGREDLVHLV